MSVIVARTLDQTYLVSHLFLPPQITMYDRSGRLLRVYDRRGSGPGEFGAAPYLFIAPGDTILAVEQVRLVRFSTELRHIDTRTLPVRVPTNTAVTMEGALVVGNPTRTNAGKTFLTSILGTDGKLAYTDTVAGHREPQRSVLARVRGGGFWSGRTNTSDLRLWTTGGSLVRHIVIARPWFQAWDGEIIGEPYTVRPRPRTAVIRELTPELLLVLTYVASSDWKPLGPTGTEIPIQPTTLDGSSLYDTVIEVVNAKTGDVFARTRVPQRLTPVEGTVNEFASTRQDADGHVVIDIWRVSLRR